MVPLRLRLSRFTPAAIFASLLLIAVAHDSTAHPVTASRPVDASILVYHRFGPVVRDGMTVRTATFRRQLDYLREHRYTVVPLAALVAYLRGDGPPLPPRAVVITVDDGHASVFTELWPVVRDAGIPVTLFIYPSAISNASYAMTWEQIRTLRQSGRFDIQSHTYWHPNFAVEKRRLLPDAYREFARMQFCKSASVLHAKTGAEPAFFSWPFGVVDEDLFAVARDCGYVAGVTLQARDVTARDHLMTLPRFLVTDSAVGPRFAAMLPREGVR